MGILDRLAKIVEREKLRTNTKGTFTFKYVFTTTAGAIDTTVNVSFSPLYFSREPSIVSSSPVSVNVIEFKKAGNSYVGALIKLTGNLPSNTKLYIVFEGTGGLS